MANRVYIETNLVLTLVNLHKFIKLIRVHHSFEKTFQFPSYRNKIMTNDFIVFESVFVNVRKLVENNSQGIIEIAIQWDFRVEKFVGAKNCKACAISCSIDAAVTSSTSSLLQLKYRGIGNNDGYSNKRIWYVFGTQCFSLLMLIFRSFSFNVFCVYTKLCQTYFVCWDVPFSSCFIFVCFLFFENTFFHFKNFSIQRVKISFHFSSSPFKSILKYMSFSIDSKCRPVSVCTSLILLNLTFTKKK